MGFWEIFTIILGSTGCFAFVQFLIQRHDTRKGQLAKILKQLDKNERDSIRTQMLLLMSDYPQDRAELFRLAEHYFKDLKGNWYMTTLFKSYLKANKMETPEWVPANMEACDND